jgi:TRAP-type C4-dicarboxylate transport system permease small subunit
MKEPHPMAPVLDILRVIDKAILRTLKTIAIVSFFLLTILITANVFVRFVPVVSLHWFDEIIELLFAYMVFYGAAALWITNEHFSVGDWIEKRIADVRLRHVYKMILELLVLIFAVIFFYYSLNLTIAARDVTNVFAIPKRVLYSCLPISGMVMVIYTIRNIVIELCGIIEPQT